MQYPTMTIQILDDFLLIYDWKKIQFVGEEHCFLLNSSSLNSVFESKKLDRISN